MIGAWDQFVQADGDLAFFSDLKDMGARLSLKSIKAHFDDLKNLNTTLDVLYAYCIDRDKSAGSLLLYIDD